MDDTKKDVDKELEEKNIEAAKKNLIVRRALVKFLDTIFIRKYSVTATLLGQLLVPLSVFAISLLFAPEIRNILNALADSFLKTSTIKYGGFEFVVDRSFFRSTDLEALDLIQQLSQEELILVIDMSGSPIVLKNLVLQEDEKEILIELNTKGIVSFISYASNSEVELEQADEIIPTDMGIRIYDEVQNISLYFIKNLPKSNFQE